MISLTSIITAVKGTSIATKIGLSVSTVEEDEFMPLQKFYDKVAKLKNINVTGLQNALVIAKRNVAACAFQRAEITEYLHAK